MSINENEVLWDWVDRGNDNIKALEKRISNLEKQIINDYKISSNRLQDLITFSTWKWLDEIKMELGNQLESVNWKEVDYDEVAALLSQISKYKEQITNESKLWRESLISEIWWWNPEIPTDMINAKSYLVSSLFPESILERASNPKNIWDNLVWLGIWAIETIAYSWKLIWQVWLWVVKLPYHLYQIATWKAKYDWFKNV